MKASIKFRDDQKPLLRAKVPINILSFPFQSSVVAGDSKDLSLNLSTHFDFGPCFKISYKPNNVQNPFALVCKTGIGHYGSPNSSPLVMSAEFNVVGSQNPRFLVHFKPQIGDFLAKKYCSSVELGGSKEFVTGKMKNGYFSENGKIGAFSVEAPDVSAVAAAGAGVFGNLVAGMEMSAKTVLPIGKRVGVNFKWGVRVLPEGHGGMGTDMVLVGRKGDWASGINQFKKFCPVLVMNKIGIEQVARDEVKERGVGLTGNANVAEACLNMKKQLEVIQAENGLLSKALDELRADIAAGKMNLSFNGNGEVGRYREGERNGWKSAGGGRGDGRSNVDKKASGSNVYGGKGAEEERHEELKKALMGASGA